MHHSIKCTNSNNPIVVIREPFERFKTMYFYWKYGNLRTRDKQNSEKSLNNFIKMLKTEDTTHYNRIFWYVHTKPQFFWLEKCTLKNITVIRYTKKNLLEKFEDIIVEYISKDETLFEESDEILENVFFKREFGKKRTEFNKIR